MWKIFCLLKVSNQYNILQGIVGGAIAALAEMVTHN
jgi:hypothetical protein